MLFRSSAQAAYDAVMSGLVYIVVKIEGENTDAFLVPFMFGTKKIDVEIVSVLFMARNINVEVQFYAGLEPV